MSVQPTEVYSWKSGVNSDQCSEFNVNQLHMFNSNWPELETDSTSIKLTFICSEFTTKSEYAFNLNWFWIVHSVWNRIFDNLKLTEFIFVQPMEGRFDWQSCEVANRKRDVNEQWSWVCVSCTVCRGERGGAGRKRSVTPSVVHLLEELVGGVFIAVLLHLGQVAFLRGHGSVHLKWFRFQKNQYFISFDSYSSHHGMN